MLNRATTAAILVFLIAGCVSMPKASPIDATTQPSGDLSNRVVYLQKCADGLPEDARRYCDIRVGDLYNALVSTKLFRKVVVGEKPEGIGDFAIDLYDFERRPYWASPPHNPAFLLMSLAIPFWWSEPLGFYFGMKELPDGPQTVVDTRWKGTSVMWSLASVLNVLPGRTFESTFSQDVTRLKQSFLSKN